MSSMRGGARPCTVLVTDGRERSALAVVRSLGRAGHRVYVCSAGGRSLGGASRYAVADADVPMSLRDPEGFADAVERLVAEWEIDVLLPISEASLRAILPRRERLGRCVVPFADEARFAAISDKATVLAAARELGIHVPAQQLLLEPCEQERLDPAAFSYPLAIKPTRSVVAGHKLSPCYAATPDALAAAVAAFPDEAYPLLLQQRVVGPGIGAFFLLWDGEVVAEFAHRRIREKPPAGGVSVYRESTVPTPGLMCLARSLLERFGWQGVAMVEFKVDAATGTPYLMEINGRFWGSLQLAIDAGVDFPALLVALACGERPAPVRQWRQVRSRWWWGDIDHLLARLRRTDAELALPPGSPGRLRTTLDFLKLWRPGDRNETFRWDDPRPFLHETRLWFRPR